MLQMTMIDKKFILFEIDKSRIKLFIFFVDIFIKFTYNINVNGTRCGRKLTIIRELFLYSRFESYLYIFFYQNFFLIRVF